jgi:uncharacterized protein
MSSGEVLTGLVIVVGLVGVVVPLLPGVLLVWAAVLVWALEAAETYAWVTLVLATLLIAASQVVKWTLPDRYLRTAGVPRRTTIVGGVFAVVGFFVVPVVGLVLGFVLGVYLAERLRLGADSGAWASTKMALRAVGLSMLVELAGASLAAGAWVLAIATN